MTIMPVSELRNHYSNVEEAARENGPVFLTKNGYGSMVVMTIEQYEALNNGIEAALDEADIQAASTTKRLSHDEVFGSIREKITA